jgi:hypothetical protein
MTEAEALEKAREKGKSIIRGKKMTDQVPKKFTVLDKRATGKDIVAF